jgi:hypothetical protein
MTTPRRSNAVRVPLWVVLLTVGGAAQTATRSTLDLSAGVGAASNPQLTVDDQSSAFGRISASGMHEIRSERTVTTLSLFAENTSYLKGHGSEQIFDLRGHTVHQVSANMSIFGDLGFQGDFGGQLSGRFAGTTPDLDVPPVDQPVPPVVLDDPISTGFDDRQYRLSGQVGLSLQTSARSSIALSAGAQRSFGGDDLSNADYVNYFGNGAYDHRFNEHSSAGLGVNLQYYDYDNGRSSSVLNPYLSARHQFSDQVQGTATVGVLITRQEQFLGGSVKSMDPSFSFSLCKVNTRGRLCGRASRDARSSFRLGTGIGSSALAISTSAGVDYSRQIDANQSIQVALVATRDSTKESGVADFHSTYFSLLGGYDRKLRERLAVGVNGGARKYSGPGKDPKADITATAFLRYRLGDTK